MSRLSQPSHFFAAWEYRAKMQGAVSSLTAPSATLSTIAVPSMDSVATARYKLPEASKVLNIYCVQEYCECDNCINYRLVITDKVRSDKR